MTAPPCISQLCSYCSTIDFSMLILPFVSEIEDLWMGVEPTSSGFFQKDQSPWSRSFPRLGTVRRILENRTVCDLCRLWGDILVRWANTPGHSVYLLQPLKNQDLLCWVNYEDIYNFGNFPACVFSLTLNLGDDYSESNLARITSCLSASQIDNRQTRSWVAAKGSPPPLFLSGRIRPFKLDPDRLCGWINLCKSQHESSCGHLVDSHSDVLVGAPSDAVPAGRTGQILRLIHVVNRCIVVSSPTEHLEYAALSYVWGKYQHKTSLRTDNVTLLQQSGSLQNHDLSQTIADFLDLVASLGITYGWVDALCILQDDEHDMAEQIQAMSRIYRNAFVTVINAGGDDLHAGLPGVREGTRSLPQEEITVPLRPNSSSSDNMRPETMTLMTSLSPKDGPGQSRINLSVWFSRAWTYQERMLSRRVLVISPEQVFWTCHGARFYEQFQAECEQDYVKPDVPDDAIDISLSERQLNHTSSDGADRIALDEAWRQYARCVTAFSARNLTYAGDVQNAFTGISQALTYQTGDELIWGLPVSRFDLAIGWDTFDLIERAGIKRRLALSTLKVPPQMTNIVFPSWSWMGWIGRISMTTFVQQEAGNKAWTTCYLHTTAPELRITPALATPSTRNDTAAASQAGDNSLTKGEISIDVVSQEYPQITRKLLEQIPDRTLLFFWSETSRFGIRYPSAVTSSRHHDGRGKDRPAILNDNGEKVGVCCATAEDNPETTVHGEFAIIGTREDARSHSHGTLTEVRVLLIHRLMDDEPANGLNGLYERQSIGIISQDAWNSSRPQRKLIILR